MHYKTEEQLNDLKDMDYQLGDNMDDITGLLELGEELKNQVLTKNQCSSIGGYQVDDDLSGIFSLSQLPVSDGHGGSSNPRVPSL